MVIASFIFLIHINYCIEPSVGITRLSCRTISRYIDVSRYKFIPTPFTTTDMQSWREGGNFSRFVGGMGEIFPRNYNVSQGNLPSGHQRVLGQSAHRSKFRFPQEFDLRFQGNNISLRFLKISQGQKTTLGKQVNSSSGY